MINVWKIDKFHIFTPFFYLFAPQSGHIMSIGGQAVFGLQLELHPNSHSGLVQ